MDGLSWMLKSMGLDCDTEEIKKAIELAKILIPKIAEGFDEMNRRLKRIEHLLEPLSYVDEGEKKHVA
jgi:hypothetical protein